MVAADGSTEDFFLPVGILHAQQAGGGRVYAIVAGDELAELVASEHVELVALHRVAHVAVVAHLRSLTHAALLRGDDDDTVRTATTIDGRCRGVFQHRERLDIVGVHHRQRVGCTLHALSVHGQSVDHNQRVVRGFQRRATADADGGAAARGTTVAGHRHTCHLTREHVLGAGDETVVLLVGLDGRHTTGEVVLLGHTITDDHHVFQHLRVVLERHHHIGCRADGCRLIAHVGHAERLALAGLHLEVSVEVAHHACLRADHTDGSSDDGFASGIFHMAFHSYQLSKGPYRKEEPQQEGHHPQR